MNRTIIFLSGFMVPKFVSKTKFVWDDNLWKDYNRIYINSKVPSSDQMVENELLKLIKLINSYDNVTVAGQSLGAWWAANLACRPKSKINKLVMWTPLTDTSVYPIFNVSNLYYPPYLTANKNNIGLHKSIVFSANHDLIVPAKYHCLDLIKSFNAYNYVLNGGHLLQSNHKAGLNFMKDWIEID